MELKHIGLVCRSEDSCDRFYGGLLGLAKSDPRTIPAALARQIFNRPADLTLLNYTGPGIHFEIFLDPQASYDDVRIAHVCLAVSDMAGFLKRCSDFKAAVSRIPKPGGMLTFVRDDDGNLFEIKEAKG